ncbi:hypothetical protein ACFE04_003517 [Oxalis oulophora]
MEDNIYVMEEHNDKSHRIDDLPEIADVCDGQVGYQHMLAMCCKCAEQSTRNASYFPPHDGRTLQQAFSAGGSIIQQEKGDRVVLNATPEENENLFKRVRKIWSIKNARTLQSVYFQESKEDLVD